MGMIWKDKAEWEGFQCEGGSLHKGSEAEKHRGYSRGCEEPAGTQKVFTPSFLQRCLIKPKGRAWGRGRGGRPRSCLCTSSWGPFTPPEAALNGDLVAGSPGSWGLVALGQRAGPPPRAPSCVLGLGGPVTACETLLSPPGGQCSQRSAGGRRGHGPGHPALGGRPPRTGAPLRPAAWRGPAGVQRAQKPLDTEAGRPPAGDAGPEAGRRGFTQLRV